ncbi:hypothetical protein PsAD13_00257 [Pseudovibrio sp. Ad13]|nr:hypothetical protein PsAD13_00257 [Pseudovibrio sp. Ad13]
MVGDVMRLRCTREPVLHPTKPATFTPSNLPTTVIQHSMRDPAGRRLTVCADGSRSRLGGRDDEFSMNKCFLLRYLVCNFVKYRENLQVRKWHLTEDYAALERDTMLLNKLDS